MSRRACRLEHSTFINRSDVACLPEVQPCVCHVGVCADSALQSSHSKTQVERSMPSNSVCRKRSFTHSKHALHAHLHVFSIHTRDAKATSTLPSATGMGTEAANDLHSSGGSASPLVLIVYQASNLEGPPCFAHVAMQVANGNQPGCCWQECGQPWQLQVTAAVRSYLFALAFRKMRKFCMSETSLWHRFAGVAVVHSSLWHA